MVDDSNVIQEILKLAQAGVYRNEIINFLSVPSNDKQIVRCCREARLRGMYSVPDMRGYKKGTFYQYDGELE